MPKVIFEFATKEVAEEFAHWMCEQGEQDYWTAMELSKGVGEVVAQEFDYGTQEKGDIVVKCKEGTL